MNAKQQRQKRRARIRAKISGTAQRPRLSVFRSNQHIFVQLIDDVQRVTIASSSTKSVTDGKKSKKDVSFAVGEDIAKKAKDKKITTAVFDRGGYRYHGRVAQVAEGARKGGLSL